jgi:hypothetical protein
MFSRFQERAQDRIPLGGLFESHFFQMLMQDSLRFPDHLW